MKNKAIGIIIGIISGIIIFVSIINLLYLYVCITDTTSREKIDVWISFSIQIIMIILMIITCLNYKKWKKSLIITIIFISVLSFIIPVRKGEEWETIHDPNPSGFYGAGSATFEKYEVYYNIYGIFIKRNATGEITQGPC